MMNQTWNPRESALPAAIGRREWLLLPLAALVFCAAAIVNGGPIAFPDSLAYMIDAERLAKLQAPYAVRPVLYGVLAGLLSLGERFFGVVLFVQALVLAHVLWLVARRVGARPGVLLWGALGLTALTPLSWHVSHLLPDVFIPIMALSLFLLGYCTLSRWERAYLMLLAAAAAATHLTALPIGAAVLGTAILIRLLTGYRVALLSMAAPLACALAGLLAFSMALWQQVSLAPKSPPFVLARMLADGPAQDYLRATCPGSGYALCGYLGAMPDTEDDFLWRTLPRLPPAEGARIKAEAGRVMLGTAAMFPGWLAWTMAANTVRQLVTFGADTQLDPEEWDTVRRDPAPLARVFSATREARGEVWWVLPWLNLVFDSVAALSAAVALGAWWRARRSGLVTITALIVTVLVILLANAFLCGALSGVFARYQGRVEWLLPFAAALAWEVLTPRQVSRGRDVGPGATRG